MALPNMRQVYIFLGMILFFNIKLSIQECSPHDLQRPYVEIDPIEAAQNGQPVILFNPAYKEWLFVSGDKIKDDNIVESGCWNGADPQRLHFILSPAGIGKLFMKSPSKGKYMFVALHDKKGKDHMVEAQYKKIDRSIFEFRNQSDGTYHIYNTFKKHNVFVSNDLWNGDNLALSHPTHHIEERNKFRVQLPGTIKVENVEYNLDAAKKETVTPVVIATQTVHNGGSSEQSQTFEFEKGVEEESSFNHEAGIELSASAEFEAGAPLVTSATYTLGISASYTHSWGKSTTETSNVVGSFPIVAPPNTTVVATATMQKTKLDVPFKITLRTSEGKVFYNHGTWKGVSHWGLQSTFKEYPLHQEPSHKESIVTKNNLLAVIPEWGPNYKISFELNVESFANGGKMWGNVFHFTATGKDCCNIGDRVPALFTNSGNYLYACTNIDDDGDKCWTTPVGKIKTHTWYSVEYEQKFVADQWRFTVKINGWTLVDVVNKKPGQFQNVQVYASDNFYAPSQSKIRNFQFTSDASSFSSA